MAKIENDCLIIQIANVDGATLVDIQEALILGIEKIGNSEVAGEADHKKAIYYLSEILRKCLLNESQANVAVGGRPYTNPSKRD